MRQKILIDIKSRKNPLRLISSQVNLNRTRIVRIPLKFLISGVFVLFFIISLIFNFAVAPTYTGVKAASLTTAEERKALEAELADLEKQIDDTQAKISEYKKQGTTLQSEIKRLNSLISKANLQIKAISLNLKQINNELNVTQSKILDTQNDIDKKKVAISNIIQNIYENEKRGNLAMLLANLKISNLFMEVSNLTSIQDQLKGNLEDLTNLQNQLADQQQTLALEKMDTENLKAYQEKQALAIKQTQAEKNNLLKTTKGKESEYQKILTQTKQTAAQIRNRLFELLGGGEMKFEDAYKMAEFASAKTGIRPAMILAVLDRESALGQNVGRCKYNQINPRSGKPAMHPTRDMPIFMEITKKLNIDPNSIMVSCANSDGAYGGAMGPAQFIPSTWALYENEIASLTGSNSVSPWRNSDAFMATALYLQDAYNSSSCIKYSQQIPNQAQMLKERCAAAKYYAGSRWYTYRFAYGDPVVVKANRFEQDIATLIA